MKTTFVGFCVGALLLLGSNAWTQDEAIPDAVTASPEHYEVLGSHEHGRLLRAHWAPGESDAMHEHPPLLAYVLSAGTMRLTAPDGTTREMTFEPGMAMAIEPDGPHVAENIGDSEMSVLLFEYTGPTNHAMVPDVPDSVTASPDHYRVLAEGGTARLVLGTWGPGETDVLHQHPPIIVYALTDGSATVTNAAGEVREHAVTAGMSMVPPVDDGGHITANTGEAELQILVFELR